MERSKILRLVLSIAIALGLWIYVINVVNPSSTTTVKNIPVTLVGTEELAAKNLAITGSGEYTVDITARASRTDLSIITGDNFVATADVSGLTMGQDYITVEVEAPKGYTVEEIRSRKIQVYVDELYSVVVPVKVVCSSASPGHEATVIDTYPQYVEVSGAKQLIDNVDSFEVALDSQLLSYESVEELTLEGSVKDKSGNTLNGLNASNKEITVWATIYSTKTVTLNTRYSGTPWSGTKLIAINAPSSITIKSSTGILSGISEINTEWIWIDGIYEDYSQPINPILPDYVYVADKDKDLQFSIDLEDNGKLDFVFYTGAITTEGLAEGYSADYSLGAAENITVTVSGPVATIKSMSASDIILSVDASDLKEGTKNVNLNVSTKQEGVNVSVSPSVISIEIRK